MADINDVYNAFIASIMGVLYPAGSPSPGLPSPVTGTVCRVYAGWPAGQGLDADERAGIVNVSVFSPPSPFQNTTRYPRQWTTTSPPLVTITASVSGTAVTFLTGAPTSVPQNIAIVVDGQAFVYTIKPNQTLSQIAQAMAALISLSRPATANGQSVIIPNSHSLVVRAGGFASAVSELQRITRRFDVHLFCSTPAQRDQISGPLVPVLAGAIFLPLADGTSVRTTLTGDSVIDSTQKPLCYQRVLTFSGEYPVTDVGTFPEVVIASGYVQGATAGIDAFTPANPPPVSIPPGSPGSPPPTLTDVLLTQADQALQEQSGPYLQTQ